MSYITYNMFNEQEQDSLIIILNLFFISRTFLKMQVIYLCNVCIRVCAYRHIVYGWCNFSFVMWIEQERDLTFTKLQRSEFISNKLYQLIILRPSLFQLAQNMKLRELTVSFAQLLGCEIKQTLPGAHRLIT